MAGPDVRNEIKETIFRVAGRALFPGHRAEDNVVCKVEAGDDAQGDEVLFIHLFYQKPGIDPDAKLRSRLLLETRKALVSAGEDRFPHIRHVPHLEQALAG